MRAMLEAICFQTLDVLAAMQQDADCSQLRVMFVDGGASQNNLLMQVRGFRFWAGCAACICSLNGKRLLSLVAAARRRRLVHTLALACLMPVCAWLLSAWSLLPGLLQIQADILQVPVRRPAHLETTSLGAALAAGIGVGFWTAEEAFTDLKHNTGGDRWCCVVLHAGLTMVEMSGQQRPM